MNFSKLLIIILTLLALTGCRETVEGEIVLIGNDPLQLYDEDGKAFWLGSGSATIQMENKSLFPDRLKVVTAAGAASFKAPQDLDLLNKKGFFISGKKSQQPINLKGQALSKLVKREAVAGHIECILKAETKTEPAVYGKRNAVHVERIYELSYRIYFLTPTNESTQELHLGYFTTKPMERIEREVTNEEFVCTPYENVVIQ